ncbi:putative transmembrane protein [Rhizoctonia solani 123E]|uniref:Putative transmembrane protein n=1 Tax=Rhizoctonia solani 123E TaxID=1423351 RepID=A0A074S5Q7_9AGAM|nr:putative transmembrane protein [Rhizoctonia solani 123E]
MSERVPFVDQRHKTESASTLSNGSGDPPAPVPNGVSGGSHTPTPSGVSGAGIALVASGDGVLISAPAPDGPPPPYSEEPRRSRRPTIISNDSGDEEEYGEGTPLLRDLPRRSRAASYSTMASYTGVDVLSLILGTQPLATSDHVPRSFRERRARYFVPLGRRVYWRSLAHLAVINFPFALAAWILLFCGVVLGTTLLITLPFGVVFWFLTLFLSRSFARAELHLQSKFHRPLRVAPPDPPRPIFYRSRPPEDIERVLVESGTEVDVDPTIETSFLKNSYSMFMDPSSFQPIFYFLVIKASITLVVTPLVLALAPVCIILVLPAPAMLRVVRRVGAWQANLAIEALS